MSRRFDWISFLNSRSIPFVTSGPSATRGYINIRCPWCLDDPGEHLGIDLTRTGYHCWRNPKHAGPDPARLVAALLRCTLAQAITLTGGPRAVPDDWAATCRALLAPEGAAGPRRPPLVRPKEFRAFQPRAGPLGLQGQFLAYMAGRGIADTAGLSDRFGVHWCTAGTWRYRVLFTVTYARELVGWTGRSVVGSPLRYKAHTANPDKARLWRLPPAPAPINHYLWRYDELARTRADTLVVCEGPFDALTVAYHGHGRVEATCLFGIAPTAAQIKLLHRLLPRFRRCYITPDCGAEHRGMATLDMLAGLGADITFLPPGIADPGALTARAVQTLWRLNPND